jgi:hypothetical protein
MPSILWQGQGMVVEGREGSLPDVTDGDLTRVAGQVLAEVHEGETLCFLAYLPSDASLDAEFRSLRAVVRDAHQVATSHGFGPRYLHSTGQMHKGGPDHMVFVLLTADRPLGVAVPRMGVTFNLLQRAQAIGDLQVLVALGRRAYNFHLDATERLPAWFASFRAACENASHA